MKSKFERRSTQESSADGGTNTNLGDTTVACFPPTRCLGRYVIEKIIGAGGMDEVYRAQDTRLERKVAIKILPHDTAADSSFSRRFLNEARTASALNHPNIVAIYDICTEKNVDFIVMEHYRWTNSREAHRKRDPEPGPAGWVRLSGRFGFGCRTCGGHRASRHQAG
jgi:serine/threonine protein kinase